MNRLAAGFATVLALCTGVSSARAQAATTAPSVVTVRICTTDPALGGIERFAQQYNHEHKDVRVEVGGFGSLAACTELAEGKADLVVLYGGDDPYQYSYRGQDGKHLLLSSVFSPGQLKSHLLGRIAMAMVVNPRSELEYVTAEQLTGLLNSGVRAGEDPLSRYKLTYVHTGILGGEIRKRIQGPELSQRSLGRIKYEYAPKTGKLLDDVAADARLMLFCMVTDGVWSSGLRVLPVQLADGKQVLPTAGHVLSGAYPYCNSLLLVEHPDASAAARRVAQEICGRRLRASLTNEGWITPETPEPGKPRQTIWPAVASPSAPAATAPAVVGSVAVLPIQQLSAYFRMSDAATQAKYEDDVTAGIAAARLLTLVDRSQIKKVLSEKSLQSAASAKAPGPVISADVLVMLQVITREAVAYLRIEAFHSGTASCIGLLELPIDPSRSEAFAKPLTDLARQWWPGVVANLARAKRGPVVTLTEEVSSIGDDEDLARTRLTLEARLSDSPGIFFARYSYLPAAQREVLMRLMGLSRPAGTEMAVAADYIVVLSKVDDRARIMIRTGKSMSGIASLDSPDGASASKWLGERIAAMSKSTAAEDGAAVDQSRSEFLQGSQLKKEWTKLQTEAIRRSYAANRDGLFPEDQARLDDLERRMGRHFERAFQLNPASEAAAYENIGTLNRKLDGEYTAVREFSEVCLAFLDNYPRSPNTCIVMERTYWAMQSLCRYLEKPGYVHEKVIAMPAGLDRAALVKQYRRRQLTVLAEYMKRYIAHPEARKGNMYGWQIMTDGYRYCLDQYANNATADELEEALAEYGSACDAWPAKMPHSDFMRLRYYAQKGDKAAYKGLLARMQQRWPDSTGPRWKDSADDVRKQMSELFKADGGSKSFDQWVSDKRDSAKAPQAASSPASAPSAAKGNQK